MNRTSICKFQFKTLMGFVICLMYYMVLHMKYITWCKLLIYVVHLPFNLIVVGFLPLTIHLSTTYLMVRALSIKVHVYLLIYPQPHIVQTVLDNQHHPTQNDNILPSPTYYQTTGFKYSHSNILLINALPSYLASTSQHPLQICHHTSFIALIFCCTNSYKAKSCLYIIV